MKDLYELKLNVIDCARKVSSASLEAIQSPSEDAMIKFNDLVSDLRKNIDEYRRVSAS
jgi:hypothetical protein